MTRYDIDAIRLRLIAGESMKSIGHEYGVTRQAISLAVAKADPSFDIVKLRTARRPSKLQIRDQRYILKYGCSRAVYETIPPKSRNAYVSQRSAAKRRGIEWCFNLWQWWCFWLESGKWGGRGRGRGFVMARFGDIGPYSVDNVYICTQVQNMKDSYVFKPASRRRRTTLVVA